MPSLRQTFDLAWDGKPTVRVTTSARDMADAQELADKPGKLVFALLHSALVRGGHDVPDLEEWIDLLDEMEPVNEGVPADPTQAADTTNGQLPSGLPQVPISISG